ncbi:hypothetical protein CHUAL_011045 [Chamberlinius hualienensis]
MRRWKCQCLLIGALLANVIILYYFWKLQTSLDSVRENQKFSGDSFKAFMPVKEASDAEETDQTKFVDIFAALSRNQDTEISKYVTVVLREFEFFENDLSDTVYSVLKILPSIKIVVLTDAFPYPPLNIPVNSTNVKLIVLHPQLDDPPNISRPEKYIDTPWILFIPSSVRLKSVNQIMDMLAYVVTHPNHIAAAKIDGEKSSCHKLIVDLKTWTLESKETTDLLCDAVAGETVLLLRTNMCLELAQPFARPFPHAFFIQTTLKHFKVYLMENVVFQRGRPLFLDSHLEWKHLSAIKERTKMLYEDFGIKKVVLSSGDTEWFGCTKFTPRCFGTVVNDTPQYLYLKRWTPPCCLERLRETARHVFQALKKDGVRYWLEGGSLLGAARNGDIIPWDYDIDIGIYEEDIKNCEFLRDSVNQPVITEDGFVWEKATEGDFFRVQYSQMNHLHVDIYPFHPKNGIMTKNTWMKNHRQDMEFPEHYLRPLSTIPFVGLQASAPNNIREFLELKFSEGVLEKYEYPNPKLISYSTNNS